MSADRTITYLKIASGIVIGFGLFGFLGVWPAMALPIELLLDLIFWPIDGGPSLATPGSRLLVAIASGALVGWGSMIWIVATELFKSNPQLSRKMILTSVLLWFVIDSIGSIISGAPLNAVFNLGFVALFYMPLRQIDQPAASRA